MSNFIYLRGLKHSDLTVFGVEKGQKTYYDPIKNWEMPYSSGQQVKRSIMMALLEKLNVKPAPITFINQTKKTGGLGEGAALSLCDPSYPDQLIGGYMKADKKSEQDKDERTIKRRSPISISALRPLHPDLASVHTENASFDRRDQAEHHKVEVRDKDGRKLSEEEIVEFLDGENKSLFHKWLPPQKKAGGLFVYDIAIDLRRLFTVSTNQFEPEMTLATINDLREKGWMNGETVFGKCLVAPPEQRRKMTAALAHALVNWQITSNQSRSFSLMETLAIAISDNANKIASTIRVSMVEESQKVEPFVDESINGVNVFVSKASTGYLRGATTSGDALEKAEIELVRRIEEYTSKY